MSKNRKSFLIVGLGRFGISLCEKLAALGQSVIGVDSLPEPVNEMASVIDVAAQLDVSDERALRKIGAKDVDVAIVTMGKDIESSILSTSILVDMGIPLVVARASNSLHAKVLARVGAHRIVFPEWDLGIRLADTLVYPWHSYFTEIENGNFSLGKIRVLPDMVGHTMAELKFAQRYNAVVVLTEHDGAQEFPSSERKFRQGDMLWVIGRLSDMGKLAAGEDNTK